jgi:hypothetical protein
MLMFSITEEYKQPKRKVRCWVKELYRQRMQYGNRLMRDSMTFELVEDTIKNFRRMLLSDFEHITSLIEMSEKMDTQF